MLEVFTVIELHKQSELLNIIVSSWPCPSQTPTPPTLPVWYLLIICSLCIDSIPEFQHFTHGVQVMTCQLLSFNLQFCDSTTTNTTKWQSGQKCVVNFNHRIISGSCPEPKTFYLLWIMLIHNFVLYNIIKTFCQAKQVLKAVRKKTLSQKKPKRWLITVSLVKWYKKKFSKANLCEIYENK